LSARSDVNAEGVREFQPRVARASALPWEINDMFEATLKGLSKAIRENNEPDSVTELVTLKGFVRIPCLLKILT
jgi:hypothetical protein